MGPFTHGEVEAAASAMVAEMFAPHELPLDEDLWDLYFATAKCALEAASRHRADTAAQISGLPISTAQWKT